MFQGDRRQLRQHYIDAWKKRNQLILSPLENQIIQILHLHPEYHALFENPEDLIEKEFEPHRNQMNPFLHLSLHLSLMDQITLDKPHGIQAIYQKNLIKNQGDKHKTAHEMIDSLMQILWEQSQSEYPENGGEEKMNARYLNLLKGEK